MTKVHKGDYIVFERSWDRPKTFEVVKTGPSNGSAQPAHIQTGTQISFAGLLSGKEKAKKYTQKVPDQLWLNVPSVALNMNQIRIPPPEAQDFFAAEDTYIADLERQIIDHRRKKREYAKEHRLEWDIPTFEDLSDFLPER